MKIRLALLESDKSYLEAVSASFETRYNDKLEVYCFTDRDTALSSLSSIRADVFLSAEYFDIEKNAIPSKCAFAYMTDSSGVETVKGEKAICKFQKADIIYKQILNLFSEKTDSLFSRSANTDGVQVIFFTSVSGGTGASSVAAAAALRYAGKGKKVFYLNLEKLAGTDAFFDGSPQFDMSDVIFALKSRKGSLALKLESCAAADPSGVCYYAPPKLALDMFELEESDVKVLINELKISGQYDVIIVDCDFSLEKNALDMFRNADSVIWVGDGSEISNIKTEMAYKALSLTEQNADYPLTNRIYLIYNRFSSKTGTTLDQRVGLKSLGGAPKKEHASSKEIINWLSEMTMLDNIP